MGDCRAVEAHWHDGHWWVWMDPSKKDYRLAPPHMVPDEIVQQRDDNPTGHSILCASPVQPEALMYCFIPEAGA
jgi:hypothetical protein